MHVLFKVQLSGFCYGQARLFRLVLSVFKHHQYAQTMLINLEGAVSGLRGYCRRIFSIGNCWVENCTTWEED
jgi:hypothetical protein